MSEGIKPFNPESNNPSEYLGNWADGSVAEKEESVIKEAELKRGQNADYFTSAELYQAMDDADIARNYRDNWDKLDFENQVSGANFMLTHPKFIEESGHTETEFREILGRAKMKKVSADFEESDAA